MCNCWCERWFPEPKCTCTLVGRCRCWLEFVAWWKTKLSPQVQICQRWLYSRIMILAVPTLEENIVLIQSSLFTLMIIVVCKLDYLMYIKYVNTGDSSLTAERSFFFKRGKVADYSFNRWRISVYSWIPCQACPA